MTCMTYAKQVWTDDLGKSWTTDGSEINTAPQLYAGWTGSKSTSKTLSSSHVPCLVLYTDGGDGHTAVITEYTGGQFHYKDFNGKKAGAYDDRMLSSDGVVNLFNSLTFKGILY